jgi:hypothetical protein
VLGLLGRHANMVTAISVCLYVVAWSICVACSSENDCLHLCTCLSCLCGNYFFCTTWHLDRIRVLHSDYAMMLQIELCCDTILTAWFHVLCILDAKKRRGMRSWGAKSFFKLKSSRRTSWIKDRYVFAWYHLIKELEVEVDASKLNKLIFLLVAL